MKFESEIWLVLFRVYNCELDKLWLITIELVQKKVYKTAVAKIARYIQWFNQFNWNLKFKIPEERLFFKQCIKHYKKISSCPSKFNFETGYKFLFELHFPHINVRSKNQYIGSHCLFLLLSYWSDLISAAYISSNKLWNNRHSYLLTL